MDILKDNNISKYNNNIKYYCKLNIIKCNFLSKTDYINNTELKLGKLYKFNDDILQKLNEYCINNKFNKEEQDVIITKYYNKYKYSIKNYENKYIKKELINGKIINNNLLYCELSTPINFYEIPNIIYNDEKNEHKILYIKEYIEIKKNILDNKLIENPKLIIEIVNNNILISFDIFNHDNNYNNNNFNDLINILKILDMNIDKKYIIEFINNLKEFYLK